MGRQPQEPAGGVDTVGMGRTWATLHWNLRRADVDHSSV